MRITCRITRHARLIETGSRAPPQAEISNGETREAMISTSLPGDAGAQSQVWVVLSVDKSLCEGKVANGFLLQRLHMVEARVLAGETYCPGLGLQVGLTLPL